MSRKGLGNVELCRTETITQVKREISCEVAKCLFHSLLMLGKVGRAFVLNLNEF